MMDQDTGYHDDWDEVTECQRCQQPCDVLGNPLRLCWDCSEHMTGDDD